MDAAHHVLRRPLHTHLRHLLPLPQLRLRPQPDLPRQYSPTYPACPSTPNLTLYDHTNRKCVTSCPVNTYAAANQSCLASTPLSMQPVPLVPGETPTLVSA